jgi:hypothetical protein
MISEQEWRQGLGSRLDKIDAKIDRLDEKMDIMTGIRERLAQVETKVYIWGGFLTSIIVATLLKVLL